MFTLIYTVAYLTTTEPMEQYFRVPTPFPTIEACEAYGEAQKRNFNRIYKDEKKIEEWSCKK